MEKREKPYLYVLKNTHEMEEKMSEKKLNAYGMEPL